MEYVTAGPDGLLVLPGVERDIGDEVFVVELKPVRGLLLLLLNQAAGLLTSATLLPTSRMPVPFGVPVKFAFGPGMVYLAKELSRPT